MTAQRDVQSSAGERLERTVFFGSADVQGTGLVVSHVNLSCVFGSARLDLRAATLAEPEVTVACFLLFGNLELRLPAAWRVVTEVQPIFGSTDERGVAAAPEPGAPTLRVRGTVLFGSAELERF